MEENCIKNNQEPEELIIDDTQDENIPFEYAITSYGADYPVDSLVKRLDKDVIFIPHFQREYVWNLSQASRFIESLLLGLPVPGIFMSKEPNTERLLVIDGQQRLKTLQFFYEGVFGDKKFTLKGVQEKFNDKTYKTLDAEDRLRLDDAIIHATIVKQDEPSEDESSIYHIFERLNTGGTLLQSQEIRACIFHGEFDILLEELSKNENWKKLAGVPKKRLKDQELILRYFAFHFEGENYKKPIKEFLNNFMGHNRHLKVYPEKQLKEKFESVVEILLEALGDKAFRFESGLNAAILDSVMTGMACRLEKGPVKDKRAVKLQYDELLKQEDFINACQTGTSDEKKVSLRLDMAKEYFSKVD
jgi:hypothetical protein